MVSWELLSEQKLQQEVQGLILFFFLQNSDLGPARCLSGYSPPRGFSSIPETHMIEGENQLLHCPSIFNVSLSLQDAYIHT